VVVPKTTFELDDWSVLQVMVAVVVAVLEAIDDRAGVVVDVTKVWSVDVEVLPNASADTTAK